MVDFCPRYCFKGRHTVRTDWVGFEFRLPYSQRHLFNAIPDTNHNANPTNPNRYSKGKPNPTNPNTRYRCKYDNLNSNPTVRLLCFMFIKLCKIFNELKYAVCNIEILKFNEIFTNR